MTDDDGNITQIRRGRGRPKGSKNRPKNVAASPQQRYVAPTVPKPRVDLDQLTRDYAHADGTNKARAAVRMATLAWLDYDEIADRLGYPTAAHARAAVTAYVGKGLTPEDIDVLRTKVVAELERSVRRSSEMASADYLEDPTGKQHANTERLAWHAELRRDLEVIARISGAQAAAQVQLVNPESAELDDIVRLLELRDGRAVHEPTVLMLEEVQSDADPSS